MIQNLEKDAKKLIDSIKRLTPRSINLMEVCGTHTTAISASGIRHQIPGKIKLLSGPGCPVCVTAQEDIDWLIGLARTNKVIITTFGDMMRVPGTTSTLEKEKAQGADIRVVYSCLDALKYTLNNKKPIVFIGVGFETTAPTIAVTILKAKQNNIKNFFVLPLFKLIPPALQVIASNPKLKIQGFILPGHVSTIIGAEPYEFLAKDYHKPSVITGFEPLDILQGILMILEQFQNNRAEIAIQYQRSVLKQGNLPAQKIMNDVFSITDAEWRGLGVIKNSGFKFSDRYEHYNARNHFAIQVPKPKPTGCRCGDVLLGSIIPSQCKLFAKVCNPSNPVGPCMVSTEGACAAYYKYER